LKMINKQDFEIKDQILTTDLIIRESVWVKNYKGQVS
jgi:hypothetical protein